MDPAEQVRRQKEADGQMIVNGCLIAFFGGLVIICGTVITITYLLTGAK